MTDKEKIRKEVEKRFEQIKNSEKESDSGAFYQLKELLLFIDSLQEEPTIPIVKTTDGGLWNGNMREESVNITVGGLKEETGVLKELIDEADANGWEDSVSESLEKDVNTIFPILGHHASTKGGFYLVARHFANWQKQQMMKDVKEAHVIMSHITQKSVAPILSAVLLDENKYREGDKVKLIIIKED